MVSAAQIAQNKANLPPGVVLCPRGIRGNA